MELYTQSDTSRYDVTMQAVKWLSDNSFMWTTQGRGASPRKSIINRPDYKSAGLPWSVRGAFVDGMSFANQGEIPVVNGPNFTIYDGGNFLANSLAGVWTGQTKIDDAMDMIQKQWQSDLDEG
jgi:ABC-type glycerol-3-phosphate transport system substrate-binding protein